ncbi:MAG: DNA mismatch repair endonuclease MutL [Clostridia bacterium]|nr:DNA mismatch repair endonuclease MutL [Clostridia bacterium]
MGKIILLDEITASQIAAGEVIERPASVVKEMAENAVDAGATIVTAEIKAGGIKYIKISDNGCGFDEDDAVIAFDKHATSKIMNADDLFGVKTLGFRGEALASIAAVSDVTLISRGENSDSGFMVNIRGGKLISSSAYASSKGSTFIVKELFYNTPARYKFLKKDATEAGYVADIMQKLAMAHPDVSFKLISDGKIVFHSPGNGDMLSCIHSIYGKEVTSSLCVVNHEQDGAKITGYVGVRDAAYGNRNRQHIFVNGRYIKSKVITSALDEAYKTVTMKNKFPFAVLTVNVNSQTLDVNVHPTKTEVRFADEQIIFRAVYHAIHNALFGEEPGTVQSTEKNVNPWKRQDDIKKDDKQEIKNLLDFVSSAPVPKVPAEKPREVMPAFEPVTMKPETVEKKPVFEQKITYVKEDPAESEKTPLNPLKEEIKAEIKIESEAEIKEEAPVQYETVKKYNDTSIYTDSTVIGQLFDTYIILEYKDKMVLIDQHAAHERIMYERIKTALENSDIHSQQLLLPVMLNLSSAECTFLKQNIEFFEKLGFEIEEFGLNSFAVRSIPMILEGSDIEAFVVDGINKAMQNGKGGLYDDRTVFTMACKAAVKANKHLSDAEIKALLETLTSVENHGTCPHGRPVAVTMSKYEVERKFHRC